MAARPTLKQLLLAEAPRAEIPVPATPTVASADAYGGQVRSDACISSTRTSSQS